MISPPSSTWIRWSSFGKNLDIAKRRQNIYREELGIAADLMGWKQKWHPRGQNRLALARGVGVSFHTWGGRGHASDCDLTIHPDGSVDIKMGTQDLGHRHSHLHSDCRRRHPGNAGRRDQALDRRHDLSAFGRFGRLDYPRWREFLHPPRRRGCPRRAVRQVAPALNAQPDQLECCEWEGRRQGRSQPVVELERSLRQARRHAAHRPRQEPRQEQATRPHQQRRGRRADGRG